MRRSLCLFLLFPLFSACGPSLPPSREGATTLVKRYLAPYPVSDLELRSLTKTQPPEPEGYVAVVSFKLSFKDGQRAPFSDQAVVLTLDKASRAYQVDPRLTHVAQGIEGAIGIHNAGEHMKSHPYNPSPWH